MYFAASRKGPASLDTESPSKSVGRASLESWVRGHQYDLRGPIILGLQGAIKHVEQVPDILPTIREVDVGYAIDGVRIFGDWQLEHVTEHF